MFWGGGVMLLDMPCIVFSQITKNHIGRVPQPQHGAKHWGRMGSDGGSDGVRWGRMGSDGVGWGLTGSHGEGISTQRRSHVQNTL